MLSGNIYQKLNEENKAIKIYRKMISINPNFVPALNNLAYLLGNKSENREEALRLALQASDLALDDPYISDTLGWILHLKGEFRWAQSVLEKSAQLLSDNAEVHYHLAMSYYMMGMDEAAKKNFLKALDNDAEFSGREESKLCLSILTLHIEETTAEQFIEKLSELSKKHPNDPAILTRLGRAYMNQGETDYAWKYFERAIQCNHEYVPALKELSLLSIELNEFDQALAFAKKANKINPQNPEIIHTLGWSAYHQGSYPWALSLLDDVAQELSNQPTFSMHLALANYMLGKVIMAQNIIQQTIAMDVDFPELPEARLLPHF